MTSVPPSPPSATQGNPDGPHTLAVLRVADWRVLAGVAISGVAFDLAVSSGFAGVAGAMLFFIVPLALMLSGRIHTPQSITTVCLVPVFGIWLALRESPWLLPLDVITAIVLLGTSASLARSGSVFNSVIPETVVRALTVCGHTLAAPSFLAKPIVDQRPHKLGHLAPLARGLALAAPIVIVLGVLLTSSDSVFASLFQLHLNTANIATHISVFVIGAWIAGGIFRAASADLTQSAPTLPRKLGDVEALVGLSSLVLLFAAFVITQIVVWLGGTQAILHKHGGSYAQHARQGFFQLLAVCIITLAVLMLIRATTNQTNRSGRGRWLLVLSEIAIALTLVIVAVAVQRLEMYEHAYGLTMLRLYSTVFACLIGAIFILFGISLAGFGSRRSWFLGTSSICGLVVLLALNMANPEQIVIERNVSRASHSTVPFDVQYASTLSPDAYPALVRNMTGLQPSARDRLKSELCAERISQHYSGWAATNHSLSREKQLRAQLCHPSDN